MNEFREVNSLGNDLVDIGSALLKVSSDVVFERVESSDGLEKLKLSIAGAREILEKLVLLESQISKVIDAGDEHFDFQSRRAAYSFRDANKNGTHDVVPFVNGNDTWYRVQPYNAKGVVGA